MTTFNAEVGIKTVWEAIKGTGAIIAGGSLVDWHFGKECADIDVFVSAFATAYEREALEELIKKHGFVVAGLGQEHRFTMVQDSYGRMRRNSDVSQVFKGTIHGIDVDIVVVLEENIVDHINKFDLNLKRAYYDGTTHYTEACLADIENNTVSCNCYEPQGYIRALASAQKYGMQIDSFFDISRQMLAYAKEKGYMNMAVSSKYMEMIEGLDFGDYDINVVQAADLFTVHAKAYKDPIKELKKLCKIASRPTQSSHSLVNESFSVKTAPSSFGEFKMFCRILSINLSADEKELASPLRRLTADAYMEGKVEYAGRLYRIGKYLTKLERQLPKQAESIAAARKLFETRSTINQMRIEFSTNTADLLQISTDKGWTSCQRWSFGSANELNAGVLGNLGGATVVGIFREEGDTTWNGRLLVRVGNDNTVVLEDIYSHRSELKHDSKMVIMQIAKELRMRGYVVGLPYSFDKSDQVDFESLLMPYKPYNDMGIDLRKTNKGYRFHMSSFKKREAMVPRLEQGADIDGDRDGVGMIALARLGLHVGPQANAELTADDFFADDPFANGTPVEDGDDLPF